MPRQASSLEETRGAGRRGAAGPVLCGTDLAGQTRPDKAALSSEGRCPAPVNVKGRARTSQNRTLNLQDQAGWIQDMRRTVSVRPALFCQVPVAP